LRIGHYQTSNPLRGHLEDAARQARSRSNDRRLAGYEIDVSREVAGTMDGDERILAGKDLDLAFEHDYERTVRTALLKQDFAELKRSLTPERRHPLDLRRRQHRVHVFVGNAWGRGLRVHGSDPISKGAGSRGSSRCTGDS